MTVDHGAFETFMGLALEEARTAYANAEVPVGAVLVDCQGEVLARAHNAPIRMCDPTAHAEILALRGAAKLLKNYRLPDTMLFVTLEPCAMCMGALLQARVRTLVFGASDPKGGAAGSIIDLTDPPVFNHAIEVIGSVRADESTELLRRFFQERRGRHKRIEEETGEVPKWP